MSPNNRQILEHVLRYRITTNSVLHQLFFAEQQLNAVTKVTARMCRSKLLSKYPLYHPRSYFTLGPVAVQQLGASPHRTLPLGPQALPTDYAVLAYSTLGPTKRQRLTPDELRQQCPWLLEPMLDFPHCLDTTGDSPVLELLRVDLGGPPDHVARKCDADIQVRRPLRPLEQLIRQKQFRLVIVTGASHKAAAIRAALDQHIWPDALQIRLAVVSDLLSLATGVQDGA